ncbi:MAG: hypothetical protein V4481_01245 [Patescibacteria group bacterium]
MKTFFLMFLATTVGVTITLQFLLASFRALSFNRTVRAIVLLILMVILMAGMLWSGTFIIGPHNPKGFESGIVAIFASYIPIVLLDYFLIGKLIRKKSALAYAQGR